MSRSAHLHLSNEAADKGAQMVKRHFHTRHQQRLNITVSFKQIIPKEKPIPYTNRTGRMQSKTGRQSQEPLQFVLYQPRQWLYYCTS
jgi:hypothetical protein